MIDEEMAPVHLRGLMDFNYPENGGIPIDQVESVDSIVKRFKTVQFHRKHMKQWQLP